MNTREVGMQALQPAAAAVSVQSWRRRATPLLGTLVEITLLTSDEPAFVRATDAAFARVADVHRAMSFHSPSSDLRVLAGAPAGAVLAVARDTWAVLQLALDIEAQSGGIFNPCIAPQLVAAGHLPAPGGAAPQALTAVPRLADRLVLLPGQRVQVRRPVWVDLGGIAKGYAVDCAVLALQQLGVQEGLVNAGGDLRAFGHTSHPVHLRFASGLWPVAELTDSALATSCNAVPHSVRAASGTPHIDPRSGRSVARRHSVVVQAPCATLADALTKVALICPTTAHRLAPAWQAQWRTFDFFAAGPAGSGLQTQPP